VLHRYFTGLRDGLRHQAHTDRGDPMEQDVTTPTRRRRRMPIVLGSLAGAAVLAGGIALLPSSGSGASADNPLIYDSGNYSVQLTINNGTGHTLTYMNASVSNGHWGTRPTTTIGDQGSNELTAYTDQLSGFTWNLQWSLDNGDYLCVELNSAQLTNDDPHDIGGYIAKNLDSFGDCGDPDPAFGGNESNSGGAHSWVTFDLNNDGD
jgi:hypothetical protein